MINHARSPRHQVTLGGGVYGRTCGDWTRNGPIGEQAAACGERCRIHSSCGWRKCLVDERHLDRVLVGDGDITEDVVGIRVVLFGHVPLNASRAGRIENGVPIKITFTEW